MTDEELRKILKDEIRPVKEMVEVIKKKTDAFDFSIGALDRVVRFAKDQQSVMNEKLDGNSVDLKEISKKQKIMDEKLNSHTASLIKIEATVDSYKEAYQLNKKAINNLKDRTSKIETTLGLSTTD